MKTYTKGAVALASLMLFACGNPLVYRDDSANKISTGGDWTWGPDWNNGVPGATGTTGPGNNEPGTGNTGGTGVSGPTGSDGGTGMTGPTGGNGGGDNGGTGGNTGSTAPTGTNGGSGMTGPTGGNGGGDNGGDGNTGSTAPTGTNGSSGTTGPTGGNGGGHGDCGHTGGTGPSYVNCGMQSYEQPDSVQYRSLDLLFVTDTSGSLDRERKALAESVKHFIGKLPSGIDYRIAVMAGHGSYSKWTGRLYREAHGCRKHGAPAVLRSDKMKLSEIQSHLYKRLTDMPGDSASDGGEEMMYSFSRGLDDRLAENQAEGFFRNDAALAVIFMSDENDICFPSELHGYSSFPDFVRDPDGKEGPAYRRDCLKNGVEAITTQSVLDAIRARQSGRPYLVGGVIYTDRTTIPRDGENTIGHGILELIDSAGGAKIDLATRDFTGGLSRLGQLAASSMSLKTEFVLSSSNVAPETIEVRVDGVRVLHKYHADTNTVEIPLEMAGHAKSRIEIRYCDKAGDPVPQPSPSQTPTPTPTEPSPSPSPTVTPSPTPTVTPSPSPSPTFTIPPIGI